MRIAILDTVYERFLAEHYAERPGLADEPYGAQWKALMARSFGTSDAYSHYLRALGHDAEEIVVNADQLQLAWARAQRRRTRLWWRRRLRTGWHVSVALAQLDQFRPDVVYVQDVAYFTPDALNQLKRRTRLLVGQLGTTAPGPERLKQFDLVLTSFPHFVPRLQELGVKTQLFRIGFDPRILDRIEPEPDRPIDVAFVGALSGDEWRESERVLERVAAETSIDVWGYGVDGLPSDSPIRNRYRGEAWGLSMYRIYQSARVVLNRHGDVAEGFANNMRLFEATGVGALLLTDAKANLTDLFEPGREVLTYSDADDAVEQIRRALADKAKSSAIGKAGQKRTLSDHTYAVRMAELAGILEARLH
jgi:spore maturation protein CgeB